MGWRAAEPGDLASVVPFLHRHVQSSMFLLANLQDYGIGSDAPRALNLWLREGPGPGVFGITNAGMILMQAPGAGLRDWQQANALVAGRRIFGCAGETAQVRAFLAAGGLAARPKQMDEDEPGFALQLDQLQMPDAAGDAAGAELVPLADVPRALAEEWRAGYHRETLGSPPDSCAREAARDIAGYLAKDSHRVLKIAGQPVAMTGFNAQVPDVVQIGGVYTPPGLRGRGYARLAVALHLRQAQARGATRAVLFASGPAAVRAYRAIGFEPAGSFTLVLFAPEEGETP